MSGDPDVVERPILIGEMTYDEVREKMHGITERNGVIHGDAVAQASRLDVEIVVRNTFNPGAEGTRITRHRQVGEGSSIIGISGKNNVTSIDVYDMGMADARNYMAPILKKIAREGMSLSNVPTGEDRLKVFINDGATDQGLASVTEYIRQRAISGERVEINVARNEGSVYLVGQNLTNPAVYTQTIGIVASLLAEKQLAIRDIISHEKSPSLALTVDGSRVEEIVRLLHSELIENSQNVSV